MFRNRRSSHKPSDELYKTFKANYPTLRQDSATNSDIELCAASTLTDALDVALTPRLYVDTLPKDPQLGQLAQWEFLSTGLTPAFFDNNNTHAFIDDHIPGCYTPTPGGINVIFHSHQAGDLHTPGLKYGMGTPTSMQTSAGPMSASQSALAPAFVHLPSQVADKLEHVKPSYLRNINPFQMHNPHLFSFNENHQSPTSINAFGFDLDESSAAPALPSINSEAQASLQHRISSSEPESASDGHPLAHNFRFCVTLDAATAMVKQQDEIPLTYLNKGQTYNLRVKDTAPPRSSTVPSKYRTFVRVSFEDEEQQRNPASCWQLWKEGRGTNEAHHRGGRLQAVEFAGSAANKADGPDRTGLEAQLESFDGFCVTWSPPADGPVECSLPVRFNFLSTDFSHSKGVKGIPVRLCAKTELLHHDSSGQADQKTPEVCYCKVKLFRDHGAERKLSNDVAHIKKLIDKTTAQLAQLEAGVGSNGKRKRGPALLDSQRPSKVSKCQRTLSESSEKSAGGASPTAEDDLHAKLVAMQEMFSSTRLSSLFFLRGNLGDDPDAFPVKLTGATATVRSVSPEKGALTRIDSIILSATASPLSSSQSRQPPSGLDFPRTLRTTPDLAVQRLHMSNAQDLASPPQGPIKIKTPVDASSDPLSAWIDAVGVDHSYQAPVQPVQQPVACFYVQPRISGTNTTDALHRAIYLRHRTLGNFIQALFAKCDVEAAPVSRTFRVTPSGLKILFDDDTIAALPEGQDMVAEFCPLGTAAPEWGSLKSESPPSRTLCYDLKLLY